MAGLIINKRSILPDTFPTGITSQEGIEAGYRMHEEIWGQILQTLTIPDGLVDTNGTQTLGKNGQILVPKVSVGTSIISKTQDPLLIYCTETLIPYLKGISDLQGKVQKISDFVNFVGINPGFIDRTFEDNPLLLGEVFQKKGAVCRHKTLIFKIICDDLCIESGMRGGFILQNGEYIRHLWNEVCIDGDWYVVDNAFQKNIGIFKYQDSNHEYYIRDGKKFISLREIGEGKIS